MEAGLKDTHFAWLIWLIQVVVEIWVSKSHRVGKEARLRIVRARRIPSEGEGVPVLFVHM